MARCVVRTSAVLLCNDRRISPTLGGLRTKRSRVVRVRAALIALAFLAASALGALHEAATAHVRCAAHGELIDSDGPVQTGVRAARDVIAPVQPSARGHGDEHCLLASALRASRIVPVVPAIAMAAVIVDDLASVPAISVAAPAASLYRIAPKTSPPA